MHRLTSAGDLALIQVRYDAPADLAVARQGALLDTLDEAARTHRRTGLIFLVAASVRSVEREVPDFWLGVVSRPELRIGAVAVVSPALPVRVAAMGFGVMGRLRRLDLVANGFTQAADATGWVRAALGGAAGLSLS